MALRGTLTSPFIMLIELPSFVLPLVREVLGGSVQVPETLNWACAASESTSTPYGIESIALPSHGPA